MAIGSDGAASLPPRPIAWLRLAMRFTRLAVAILGLLLCASISGCGAGTPLPSVTSSVRYVPMSTDDLQAEITAIGDEAGADVGVYAVYLDTGRIVDVNADTRFPLLSTFKVYAAAGVLRKARAGRLNLAEPVTISATDVVANSPITAPKVGSRLTIAELCQAALDYSDNTAGNLLLRELGGPEAVAPLARSLGDSASGLQRWEVELNTALPGDDRDTTTPRQLANGYRALLVDDGLDAADRDTLLGWMRASTTSAARMRAQLPPGWTTADKTGSGDYGTTNDAGLMFGPDGQRILLVMQTRDRLNRADAPAFGGVLAEIARRVAEAA